MGFMERLEFLKGAHNKMDVCPYCGCSLVDEEEEGQVHGSGKKKLAFIGIAGVVFLAAGLTFILTGNVRGYSTAEKLQDSGEYLSAAETYKELGDYKDASEKYQICQYTYAEQLYGNKNYQEAAKLYQTIPDYEDAGEKYKECRYQEANAFYENQNYADAAPVYEELGEYKDAEKLLEECRTQSTEGARFIKALARGLIDRWEYDKDEVGMENLEFKEYRRELIHKELDQVAEFEEVEFEDPKLKEYAFAYIEALEAQLKAIEYYGRDRNKCFFDWDEAYDDRSKLIKTFTEEYGLDVGSKYKHYLEDFIRNAEVAEQVETVKEQVAQMEQVEFERWADEGGLKKYGYQIKNITDVTFSYFSSSIELYDEKGALIGNAFGDNVKNFEPGQEVWFSFETSEDFATAKMTSEYSIK